MRILSSDYVIPITSQPINRGSVVLDGDKIIDIGSRAEIVERYPQAVEENFGLAAIMPGFVNCHSHLEITAMRGLLDDVEHDFGAWLLRLNHTRENTLSESDIEVAAIAGAAEGAQAGVTCFGDIGRSGNAGVAALKAVGLRGIVYQETKFSPDDSTAAEDFEELSAKINTLRKSETALVKVGVSPHAPYTVSAKLFELLAGLAIAEQLKMSIHAAESRAEAELMQNGAGFFVGLFDKFGVRWSSPGCSSIEFLDRIGVLKARPLLAHCVNVSVCDIKLIAENAVSVAHCPKSNAKFGHGWAPFERLIEAGIAVGFGSDSVASNNTCDIIDEGRFAVLGARNCAGSSRFITANETLETATIGGARALGLDDQIGSLEVGKQADIAVISLGNLSQAPINDVQAAIVFSASGRDVIRTIVAGRDIYKNGNTAMIDKNELVGKLEDIRRKLIN